MKALIQCLLVSDATGIMFFIQGETYEPSTAEVSLAYPELSAELKGG